MANRPALPPPSRVRFVVRAPSGSDEEDRVYSTLFEARAWSGAHPGWIIEAKRIVVA